MCHCEVNGVPYPCSKCKYNIETEGTCECHAWRKWFKAYWREMRKRFNRV